MTEVVFKRKKKPVDPEIKDSLEQLMNKFNRYTKKLEKEVKDKIKED